MERLRQMWRAVVERVRASETTAPIIIAVTIGLGAGLASIAFRRLIDLSHYFFFLILGGMLDNWLGVAVTIALVSLGGLIVGLLTTYVSPESKGHGVPDVMLAVAQRGGRIRPAVALFKMITAAITIGSGGSAGREGPIVQIGSAFGSTVAQLLRLPDRRTVLSVACGAAGGIAATFNAPMSGVIFALEVILSRFTALSFGLIVMSAASATVVSHALSIEGDSPAFNLVREHAMRSVPDLLFFLVLGALCSVVAWAYMRLLYLVEDITDSATLPPWIKPAIGGALVGVAAIWTPQIMGTSYETIEASLNNNMAMKTLFVLCVAKIVCTAFTVGSGGSGGIFAPALYIGAMFGGGFGSLMNLWFPGQASPPGAFALVGMAAVFGGAAHAPVTAIFILFEMTDDYRIIIPLMSATVISTLVSQRLTRESIYTMKLKRSGIDLGRSRDLNLMDAVTVAEAMDESVEAVPPNLPLTDLIERLRQGHRTGFPVVDVDGRLTGIVTRRDVEEAILARRNPDQLTVGDVCTRHVIVCRPDQTLSEALSQFGTYNFGRLPVIDPERPERIIGILDRSHIIAAYAEASSQGMDLLGKADAIQSISQKNEMVLEQAHVTAGSQLAHVYVREAAFPPESTLGAIRRASQTLVPRGSTQILPGDRIFLLTTRENARSVRRWLREKT